MELVGLPATVARERLTGLGYRVVSREARSKKGSGGTEERVLRAATQPDGSVLLTTALFVALPEETDRS